jgi:hypothetical protein
MTKIIAWLTAIPLLLVTYLALQQLAVQGGYEFWQSHAWACGVSATLVLVIIRASQDIGQRIALENMPIARPSPESTKSPRQYGIVYILRRNDGILKLGKTLDLRTRVALHRSDYKTNFDVLASWVVPSLDDYERLALRMTQDYQFSEGKRRELRSMSDKELSEFILSFTTRVQNGFKKAS